MTLRLGLDKIAAPPSHGAGKTAGGNKTEDVSSDEKKMDSLAMRMAKRAEKRMVGNEGKIPGSTIFSK